VSRRDEHLLSHTTHEITPTRRPVPVAAIPRSTGQMIFVRCWPVHVPRMPVNLAFHVLVLMSLLSPWSFSVPFIRITLGAPLDQIVQSTLPFVPHQRRPPFKSWSWFTIFVRGSIAGVERLAGGSMASFLASTGMKHNLCPKHGLSASRQPSVVNPPIASSSRPAHNVFPTVGRLRPGHSRA
jgi:hypothetical protein